jgi:hypothetical protein
MIAEREDVADLRTKLRRSGGSHDPCGGRLRINSSPLGRGDRAPRRRTVLAIAPLTCLAARTRRRLRRLASPCDRGCHRLPAPYRGFCRPRPCLRESSCSQGTRWTPRAGGANPGAGNRSRLRPTACLRKAPPASLDEECLSAFLTVVNSKNASSIDHDR